jgi:hypothetical protein
LILDTGYFINKREKRNTQKKRCAYYIGKHNGAEAGVAKESGSGKILYTAYRCCPKAKSRSSAWLEHYTDNVGVSSSNLDGTTHLNPFGGLAQLARAPALHAGGQRFDSVILHH